MLNEIFAAYVSVYPEHELALDAPAQEAWITGVPELIVQALDKLMANAASFCPKGGKITLRLAPATTNWELSVSNEGPPLPGELQDRLFDPMVSLRQGESDSVHLGLGLHIVRLIAEFLRGTARAENLPNNAGVCVALQLPAASAEPQGITR